MKRTSERPKISADHLLAMGIAAIGGGLAWYAVLMRPILAAAAYGPICGHGSLFAPHCPPCYAALSMVGAGLGLIVASRSRRLAAATRAAD